MNYATFEWLYPDVSEALVSAIRGMIIARPQHRLYVGDFSQIEALTVAWLAGQTNILDLKRAGGDLYCDAASGIYHRSITKKDKDERQVGKTAVLALGYGGGIGSLAKMCGTYGVSLLPLVSTLLPTCTADEIGSAEKAHVLYCKRTAEKDQISKQESYVANVIKDRWRNANPQIVQFWAECEQAAIDAVSTGKPVDCRRVRWFVHGDFLHCKLPAGRTIAYPFPKLSINARGRATLSYRSADPAKQAIRRGWVDTYGGSLVENITQAVARDIMAAAIMRLWHCGYRVVLTVHDEIISETPLDFGSLEDFEDLMSELPEWCPDMVVEVEAWTGTRYDKR